jgi:carboxymethylenebutenolidase
MQTTLVIGGKTIRLDAFEPRTPNPHPAVLLLHGAGGNADYWLDRLTPAIARAGIAVYAIHYFDRTGTTRAELPMFTDGIHVPLWLDTIRQAIAHIAQRPAVDPGRVALVGVSLGAFLSLAVATQPETPKIKAIVEISGGLVEPYAEDATPAFPPTLILHGDADTVVAVSHAHTLDALLTRLNVFHEVHIFRGETHWFTEGAQLRIFAATAQFLGSHL